MDGEGVSVGVRVGVPEILSFWIEMEKIGGIEVKIDESRANGAKLMFQ